jgi:hypothetical protein
VEHLFPSRVEVLETGDTFVDGRPHYGWAVVEGLESVPCRIDLTFMRAGKDTPPIIEAGRAPDRVGVAFFSPKVQGKIKPGQRIKTIRGPVDGTFSIDVLPDPAVDMSRLHHYEIGVREVSQVIS